MQKILIAVPCFDMVHTDFMESMVNLQKPEGSYFTVLKNTLINEARDIIAANAVKSGFDWVAWFDSDMRIPPDALIRLMEDAQDGREIVSGLYFTRRENIKPVCYKRLWWSMAGNKLDSGAENFYDYPDGLFECAGVGFGCCLTSVPLLKRVGDKFGTPFFPLYGAGEDLSFCWRVGQLGEKIYCDSRIMCGHIGTKEYGATDSVPATHVEWKDNKAYCGSCGKRIPAKIDAKFCHKCGKYIAW